MAHSFEENDISKYDKLYLKRAQEVEKDRKVCMLCVDIKITPNPQDPSHPYGTLIAPHLEIISVVSKKDGNDEWIEVKWVCPICHIVRVVEKFKTFNDLRDSLIILVNKHKEVGKTVYAILEILEKKEYEKLPGYTVHVVISSLRDGE